MSKKKTIRTSNKKTSSNKSEAYREIKKALKRLRSRN